jgi:hypothetical protein
VWHDSSIGVRANIRGGFLRFGLPVVDSGKIRYIYGRVREWHRPIAIIFFPNGAIPLSKNLPDFELKLKDLCDEYGAFVKKATSRYDHPKGPQFLELEISVKLTPDEYVEDIAEFHGRLAPNVSYAGTA